jgi:tricorn protease
LLTDENAPSCFGGWGARKEIRLRTSRLLAAAAVLLLIPMLLAAQAPAGDARLLRYPDIHGDTIAFVYAGDIWVVGAGGGLARRLTSHPGLELFPKFSPDGKTIAFTGEYGGNRQVYLIDVDGGTPRQLTFHNDIGDMPPRAGYDNQVLGWTPDGKQVIFRAHRVPYSERLGRPYLVPAAGGMEQPMRVTEGGNGTFSPDATKFVYTPTQTEYRGWKRYQGGQAQDLWIYDFKKDAAERITDYPGTDNQPLWIGDKIYFTSDREGGRLNLFVYDVAARAVRKLTNHDRYDVLWPSGRDRIVYENGGYIYLFDPAAGSSRRVPIQVGGDLPQTLPYFKKVAANIEGGELSPTGKRALFAARGDLFTVPAEKGEILNLTSSPGVREMSPTWSPDGRWVAYLSDRTGEYEIYMRASDGAGEERRVTTGGDVWRFPPVWSPDSKKLAFGDTNRKLHYVEVASGLVTDADRDARGPINDYHWSPDSRFLVYTKSTEAQLPAIWVYALEEAAAHQLSDGLSADYEPAFSRDGRYLYFFSDRDFQLTFSNFEFDYVYTDPTRIYVGILSKEGPALLLPESDDEAVAAAVAPQPGTPAPGGGEAAGGKAHGDGGAGAEGGDKSGKPDAVAKTAPPRTKIDYDGFPQRVRALPVAAGAYNGLNVNADGVFYVSGRAPRQQVRMFSLKDRKDKVVLEGVAEYTLSADGTKLGFHKGESWGIVDAKPGQKADDGLLALDKMQMEIHPREEWKQMFVDAGRIMRDWFYDPNLNGVDWKSMRERYGELLPYLADRDDLDFLLSEMGGEISAGHVYVTRGDEPAPERVEGGLLGAEVEADPSGYFRITHIFPGQNWVDERRSPLTESGVHAGVGDLILAVDGQSTKGVDNFYRLLENKAGHVVRLLIGSGLVTPPTSGAHEEKVRPVKSEQGLRYLEWVRVNRERVDKASGGKIGYIHLPDTAVAGNRELFKGFYQQAHKQALILDDRYNGGGFIPDRMVELLNRPLLSYWVNRSGVATSTPGYVNTGPKACLINGLAGSGGDAFPYYFRELKMGPLIGTRTWGGLIGISNNPNLLDGGSLSTPSFRFLDTSGKWDVEGTGVAPDIEVIDRPDEIAKGHDPSLERAISYLMEELRKHPPVPVTVPPPPRQPPVP